jgi:hypothetical protein
MNQRLSFCNSELKSSLIAAKLKQKKAVYIMACKYEQVLKKYFHTYQFNVGIKKEDDKIVKVSKLFEIMKQREKINFQDIYESPPIWPKKAANFVKLNDLVKKRLLDFFQSWRKNANALKFYNSIKD